MFPYKGCVHSADLCIHLCDFLLHSKSFGYQAYRALFVFLIVGLVILLGVLISIPDMLVGIII